MGKNSHASKIILAIFLMLLAFAQSAPCAQVAGDFEARLAQALSAGEIDRETADLYRLYSAMAVDKLPEKYLAGGDRGARHEHPVPMKCATPIAMDVESKLDDMSPQTRALAREVLYPEQPLGKAAPSRISGKLVTHLLPNWIETENFSIEWGSDLTNQDGGITAPNGAYFPVLDTDMDGIPDVVNMWADFFEKAFTEEFKTPAEGGTFGLSHTDIDANLITILIGNTSSDTSLDDLGSSFYGQTKVVSGLTLPVIVVNKDFDIAAANEEPIVGGESADDAKRRGAMKVTAAHELFHVLHFLDEPAPWQSSSDSWWYETISTWMEDEVYDYVNDYYYFFNSTSDWASLPEKGITANMNDSDYFMRAYGSVLFAKFLTEHVGGRNAIIDIWDDMVANDRRILYSDVSNTTTAASALDVFSTNYGFADVGELALYFAGANATMDYEEGEGYGDIEVRTTATTPLDADSATDVPLAHDFLGSSFFKDDAQVAEGLSLAFAEAGASPPGADWGMSAVIDRSDGSGTYGLVIADSGAGAVTLPALQRLTTDAVYAVPVFIDPDDNTPEFTITKGAAAPASSNLAAPANLATTALPGGFSADWDSVAGSAGYILKWVEPISGDTAYRMFPPQVTQGEVRGLLGSTAYDVYVFAYDPAGFDGVESAAVPVTTDAAASTTVARAELAAASITLTPVADPGANQTVNGGDPVALDGSNSLPALGTLDTYAWTQVDSNPAITLTGADTSTATFTAPTQTGAGTAYTFMLTVTDSLGTSSSGTVIINVVGTGTPPVAEAGNSLLRSERVQIALSADGSTDADGHIDSYQWELIYPRGYPLVLQNPDTAHLAFASPPVGGLAGGTFIFKLTVTDDSGLMDSDTVHVYVYNNESPYNGATFGSGGGSGGCFVESLFPPSLAK